MNRREFLAVPALAYAQAPATRRAPNFVFILADDLGYGDLGCYGQQQIATPNIDRLAREGLRFTQAYAGSTVCAPSRCALMTGKHMGHGTVRGNKRPELGLRDGEETIASVLHNAGYETAMFGKWGLGGPGNGSTPNRRGFDHFYGYLDQLHAHNFYPEHLWDNEYEVFLPDNWFDARKQYAPDLATAKIVSFLTARRDKPFALFCTYTLPHANNERGRAKGNGMEVPAGSQYEKRTDWPEPERGFAGMMERLDGYVGRILDSLRTAGLEDNTLVIFSSDNGPHREGNHDPEFFKSRGPLRGIKRDLYEGGIRVPFIARWPGRITPGKTSDDVIAFWDVLPTFAELAGASAPKAHDGRSFAPALFGRGVPAPPYLYWEFHEGGFAQAVRTGNWKGVRKNLGPLELYDLANDIGESRNIASAHPDVVKRIEGIMQSAHVDSPDFPITKSGSSNTPF